MKINLIEKNKSKFECLNNKFKDEEVNISNLDMKTWLVNNSTRCIIRICSELEVIYPEYYKNITEVFDDSIFDKVTNFIEESPELLKVGSSFMIKIPCSDVYLINSIVSNKKGSLSEGIKNGLVTAHYANMENVLILPFENFTSDEEYAKSLKCGYDSYKKYNITNNNYKKLMK